MRRTSLLAPIAVVAVVSTSLWGLGAGCTWPDYAADQVDDATAGDTTIEDVVAEAREGSIDDVSFTFPDGRVCQGHDEDGDGVPDSCDNCPNVANTAQAGGAIGTACAPSSAFASSATRILFDPLKTLGAWHPFPVLDSSGRPDSGIPGVSDTTGFFQEDKDGDSFLGGNIADTEPSVDGSTPPPVLHFAVGSTGAARSSTIVTTTVTIQQQGAGANAGVMLRVTGEPQHFYVCAISVGGAGGVAAAHVLDGCNGGPCAPVAFAYPDAGSTQLTSFPKGVAHNIGDVVGIRASVTTGGGSTTAGTFECRVFDPSNPSTLLSTDPSFAIKVDIGTSQWIPSGEVGLYAQRAKAQFFSIDVLAGP